MKLNFIDNKFILGTAQFGDAYGILNYKKKRINNKYIKKIIIKAKKKINSIDTAEDYNIKLPIKKSLSFFNVNTKVDCNIFKNSIQYLNRYFFNIYKNYKIETLFIRNLENKFKDKILIKKVNYIKKKFFIKKIGISIYEYNNIKKLFKVFKYDTVQLPSNIFDNRSDKLEDFFLKNNIEVHARSIFLQGLIFSKKNFLIKNFPKYYDKLYLLKKRTNNSKVSLVDLSLTHVIKKRYISKIIIGIFNINQLNSILNFKIIKDTKFLKYFNTSNLDLIDPRNWSDKKN